MSSKPAVIGYAVYAPHVCGLPYLAVTFMPDGSVVAKQFETEASANEYSRRMASGGDPSGTRH